MRIAVAYENGEIYGDFAHCPMFALYEYGEYVYECVKTLTDTSALEGHQAMAEKMKELEVDAVLCGEMSGEGKALLLSCGIVPVVGYSGDADTAADLLVTGQLPSTPARAVAAAAPAAEAAIAAPRAARAAPAAAAAAAAAEAENKEKAVSEPVRF